MQPGFDAYKLLSPRADPSILEQIEEAFHMRDNQETTVPEWLDESVKSKPILRCLVSETFGSAFARMKGIAEFDEWLCHTYRHKVADHVQLGLGTLTHEEMVKLTARTCKTQISQSKVLTAAFDQSSEIDSSLISDLDALIDRVRGLVKSTPLFTEAAFDGRRRSMYAPE